MAKTLQCDILLLDMNTSFFYSAVLLKDDENLCCYTGPAVNSFGMI
jgi:hypothetical protein